MTHSSVNVADVEPVADAMRFLRDPLDCEQLGLTVVEPPSGWTGKPHDHADSGHEEVYLVVDGAATLTVDGNAISLTDGDAVRVAPAAERQLRNRDDDSTIVIAGAP